MDPYFSATPNFSTRAFESVLVTNELAQRARRPTDHATENRALMHLVQSAANHLVQSAGNSPLRLLQSLTRVLVDYGLAEAAGITVPSEEQGREVVRWCALAGPFPANIPLSMPRDASPCTVAAARATPSLVRKLHEQYQAFSLALPRIVEALLVPMLASKGQLGTLWLILCDEQRNGVDAEDARMACDLAQIAAALFDLLSSREMLIQERDALAQRNQQLLLAERHKSEVLAIIGHELRNPLSGMQYSLSYVAGRQPQHPDVTNALNILQRQLRQTARLVDDLFDAASAARGKVQLIIERIDVSAPVMTAIETSRRLLEHMHHQLVVKLPPEPVMIEADPARLAQIVSNLLNNAAKYTPAGGHIELSAQREGGEAVIRVVDDGIGIPREMLDQIFDMYTQVTRPGSSAGEGLGIGLGVVKELVEMHGGRVEVRSDGVGRGSEFLVRLPASP